MRIGIANDLSIALAALRHVATSIPDVTVAWTAEDGAQTLDRCKADTPDLILMDMIMPVMDGVEATRRIMEECPCPIVVVTATVTGNADLVYEALGHGALDAVNTPVLGPRGALTGAEDLIRKIRAVGRLAAAPPAPSVPVVPPAPATPGGSTLVAIGASTGGPQALVTILAALPRPLPCGLVIIQHIDPTFAPGLADWLGRETGLDVDVARAGATVPTGAVAVASTEDHLVVDRAGCLRYVVEPADFVYRPSVDVFYRSLLETHVPPSVAVLLTGMGRDGAEGLLALRRAGWHTIAQDQATSVVWGMPGAAVALDAAVETLPVTDIAASVGRRLNRVARLEDSPP